MQTDWIEVGGTGFSTMVKVVLADESEAYLISVTNVNGKPEAELFKLDAKYLRGRKDFFNAVMDAWGEAEKIPIKRAYEMGIISIGEVYQVLSKIFVS